jgi:uncharacterized protein YndB with AHSA1/START domain
MPNESSSNADESFIVRRVFAAGPARLWAVWTEAEHLNRWFHPAVWTIFQSELDLRVGGSFFYGFRGPDFPPAWGLWRFTVVEPPHHLAFELSFADADRRIVPSPFGGAWPARITTRLTLEPHAGGTALTLRSTPLDASADEIAAFQAMKTSMADGWGQTLDSLRRFVDGA